MRARYRVYRSQPDEEREQPPVVRATHPNRLRVATAPALTRPDPTAEEWQRAAGNQATARALQDPHRGGTPTLVPTLLEDEGKTDTAAFDGIPWTESRTASLESATVNEWGEFDGELVSDVEPHVFVNGGKTGAGIVHWAGGNGGVGNQAVGSIALVAPVYESAPAFGLLGPSAWVRPGTGTATVTRSYRGVLVGANSTAYYWTAAAAARADGHEQMHVGSSLLLHIVHILPLELRVGAASGPGHARFAGATEAEAIAALQTYIDWNASITAFQNADTAANTPMGTVDTVDMADPTFIKHLGPRTVDGVLYNDYIDV